MPTIQQTSGRIPECVKPLTCRQIADGRCWARTSDLLLVRQARAAAGADANTLQIRRFRGPTRSGRNRQIARKWSRFTAIPAGLPIAVCVVLALAMPPRASAVTLVDQQGRPVGGQWQQWANEAKVPTIPGDLIVQVGDMCGSPACSASPLSLVLMPNGGLAAP
jgi:hypothetical protein